MAATRTKSTGKSNGAVSRIADVQESTISIQPLRHKTINFHLVGTSPLVVSAFGPKSRRQMLEAQMGKKKSPVRDIRVPEEEYLDAFYWLNPSEPPEPDSVTDGVPHYDEKRIKKIVNAATFGLLITGFKRAIISAARNTDLTMASLKQQLFVSSPEHHDYAVIKGGKPHMDARICRISNNKPMERFRPMWESWETDISVTFDANILNADVVANLLQIAGFYVGVFEGRPEKSALGWGRFELA